MQKLTACCWAVNFSGMQMQFTLTRNTPVSRYWKPKLVFTGTSIMGINPANRAPVLAPHACPMSQATTLHRELVLSCLNTRRA